MVAKLHNVYSANSEGKKASWSLLPCILKLSVRKICRFLVMENGQSEDLISACKQSRYYQNNCAYIACVLVGSKIKSDTILHYDLFEINVCFC